MTEMVDADGRRGSRSGSRWRRRSPDDGEVVGRAEPATLVATTVHRGPYDEEGPAYQTVDAWVQEHGHASAGPAREVYLTDPDETPDPADYLTEIQFPIAGPA